MNSLFVCPLCGGALTRREGSYLCPAGHCFDIARMAYIGDAAYEIVIRTILVRKANMQVNKLHRHAAGLVKAEKQSAMIEILEPLFTEEEKQIYKRGRNAKSYTKAKNASTIDYRRATGFEAVMGYLYLKGDYKRMIDLIRAGLGEV